MWCEWLSSEFSPLHFVLNARHARSNVTKYISFYLVSSHRHSSCVIVYSRNSPFPDTRDYMGAKRAYILGQTLNQSNCCVHKVYRNWSFPKTTWQGKIVTDWKRTSKHVSMTYIDIHRPAETTGLVGKEGQLHPATRGERQWFCHSCPSNLSSTCMHNNIKV